MSNFVAEVWVKGKAEQDGSIKRVTTLVADTERDRFERYVFVEPERRLVVRIWTDWAAIVAHADFIFEPVADGTRVTAAIHTFSSDSDEKASNAIMAGTQEKVREDLDVLRSVTMRKASAGYDSTNFEREHS